ncbi:hypothetical protein J3454_15650 [Erythrobacter sp. NFXS35]|uniref:transcription termination/antitermination protein NusG n=1 Tax=Erythrobacter sp. NFXS35 TaxID=2818436 RepID=UPI0032DFE4A7
MAEWFLAQVKPNSDLIAKRNLARQGFATFQPMEKRTIASGGKFREQIRPFFSGYLFVSYPETSAPWSLVNSTYGVSRLVRFGAKLAPVPRGVMTQLRAACDTDDIIALTDNFVAGATVEIMAGSFTGLIGEIGQLSPDRRAMVLLDFMGKQTKVSVPTSHLKAARASVKQSGDYQ